VPSPSGAPLADLSSSLDAMLIRSLGWLAIAAAAATFAVWWFSRRHVVRPGSVRERLLGTPAGRGPIEPMARRYLRIVFGMLWILDGLLQAQPQMAAGFGRDVLAPALATGPGWLSDAAGPLVRLFTRHPVTADAATVWVQLGLGVLLILGGTGILSRFAIWASAAWSVAVWFIGEGMGGLFSPGAGWVVGAPGAVLVYLMAAALLLAPWSWWEGDRVQLLVRRAVGTWLVIGAGLQALPWEGFWSSTGAAAAFADGAATKQPELFRQPIASAADAAGRHPVAFNALLVAALLIVGAGLILSRASGWVLAGLLLCTATWWLAQDFGVLGGMATDPNTAFPLGLLLVCALPVWPIEQTSQVDAEATGRIAALREPIAAGTATLGFGSLVVAPLVAAGLLLGPAGASAVAADGGGGVVSVPHRPAPTFALTDQGGKPVSSAGLQGKLTVVTFLDPVCSDECPLIADQLALADRALGALAAQVEFVAIDTNPLFTGVSDVAAFTTSHGLDDLPNWHFLAGSATDLQEVTAAYGIAVQVPSVGMIEHGEGIYFVGADGATLAYLGDGAAQELTQTYADAVRDEIRRLLA
jgi:cytochrome oxidase Cu insertion factor (SCO1/SenC/PrrC family)